ncbi:hypothetical protein Tsubulata_009763 [Turnera subulata]|uniref:RING-type E3 ubiquitin transferase n=1 Tax=Turnera subulata TaxID=218843 RepID=A0A9Q0F4I4_9ROSI|nr:hypothetical protein Tsubulata_009763 [Turnera subulata]
MKHCLAFDSKSSKIRALKMDLAMKKSALADLTNDLKFTGEALDSHNNYNNTESLADLEARLLKSIVDDDKSRLISTVSLLYPQNDDGSIAGTVVYKLLYLCCAFDSVACATSLLNGEVCGGAVPAMNERDAATGWTPLHAAAAASAARCVDLLLKRQGRAELKTKDGRALLPLELALLLARTDLIWNPDDHSVEDLVVQLSEKDLTVLKLLVDKTKQINEVIHARAIQGRVVELAALLLVAAGRVNDSIVFLQEGDSESKEKATVFERVVKEAILLGNGTPSSKKAASKKRQCVLSERERAEKRKLLLSEIELLQLFGAVSWTVSADHRRWTPPLVRACQAGDEPVIELLLKTDIDINDVDNEGNSALHWCIKTYKRSCPQQINIMWLLVMNGARVNQKNKLGLTAIHIAAENGNSQALQALLLEDLDCVNAKTEMRETPLFFAVKNDHKECAELLLNWGASTDEITPFKRSTLLCPQEMRWRQQNSQTDTCKYFDSPTGCVRGSKCFYAHDEEEFRQVKLRKGMIRSPIARAFERKIFVGGLPTSLDSDSLGTCFEEHFGPVEDAMVVGIPTGSKLQSRGFGFVTFKDEKSFTAAVEAHYVTIQGKEVEIKSAVPKWVLVSQPQKSPLQNQEQIDSLSLALTPGQKTMKEIANRQNVDEQNQTETACSLTEEAISEFRSWVDKLIDGKPHKGMPKWLRTFRRWFPCFLKEVSEREGGYALSSLKADFRTAFDLELDHASLGFPKLSEFMRCFPDLCRIKHITTGEKRPANHMVLLPKLPTQSSQPVRIISPPSQAKSVADSGDGYSEDVKWPKLPAQPPQSVGIISASSQATSIADSGDGYSDDVKWPKLPAQPPQPVGIISSSSQATSIPDSDDGYSDDVKWPQELLLDCNENAALTDSRPEISHPNLEHALPGVRSRFLEFLQTDSTFHSRQWGPKTERRHLVLEALARKMNNSSVFFLREFDFYEKYRASIIEGKCFACNLPRLLWANFPCGHLVWCGDCKYRASLAAGTFEHKCVVCDVRVQNIDLMPRLPKSLTTQETDRSFAAR